MITEKLLGLETGYQEEGAQKGLSKHGRTTARHTNASQAGLSNPHPSLAQTFHSKHRPQDGLSEMSHVGQEGTVLTTSTVGKLMYDV